MVISWLFVSHFTKDHLLTICSVPPKHPYQYLSTPANFLEEKGFHSNISGCVSKLYVNVYIFFSCSGCGYELPFLKPLICNCRGNTDSSITSAKTDIFMSTCIQKSKPAFVTYYFTFWPLTNGSRVRSLALAREMVCDHKFPSRIVVFSTSTLDSSHRKSTTNASFFTHERDLW